MRETSRWVCQAVNHLCVHYWVLPAANGQEYLTGECKYCPATRRFLSPYPPDMDDRKAAAKAVLPGKVQNMKSGLNPRIRALQQDAMRTAKAEATKQEAIVGHS